MPSHIWITDADKARERATLRGYMELGAFLRWEHFAQVGPDA